MEWQNFRRSDNVEDRRGDDNSGDPSGGAGFSLPGGLGAGHLGLGAIIILGLIGWALGIDPRVLIGGAESLSGGGQSTQSAPAQPTQQASTETGVPKDQIGQFVAAILAETEDVWSQVLPAQKGINMCRRSSYSTAASPAPAAAARRPRWGRSTVRKIRRSISTPPSSATCRPNMAAAATSLMPM